MFQLERKYNWSMHGKVWRLLAQVIGEKRFVSLVEYLLDVFLGGCLEFLFHCCWRTAAKRDVLSSGYACRVGNSSIAEHWWQLYFYWLTNHTRSSVGRLDICKWRLFLWILLLFFFLFVFLRVIDFGFWRWNGSFVVCWYYSEVIWAAPILIGNVCILECWQTGLSVA